MLTCVWDWVWLGDVAGRSVGSECITGNFCLPTLPTYRLLSNCPDNICSTMHYFGAWHKRALPQAGGTHYKNAFIVSYKTNIRKASTFACHKGPTANTSTQPPLHTRRYLATSICVCKTSTPRYEYGVIKVPSGNSTVLPYPPPLGSDRTILGF